MIDPQAKPKSYLRLMVLVALLGIVSALVTFTFVALVHQGTRLIWEQTTDWRWVWTRACSPSWYAPSAACWSGCW